jgi:integrase
MIETRIQKDGKRRYRARVRTGTKLDGTPMFVYATFEFKKDAERWERKRKTEVERGEFVEPSQEPLGVYLTSWLDGPARLKAREATVAGYRRLLARYVLAHPIASVRLSALTSARISGLYADLQARTPPLSPRTVRLIHALLHKALAKAVRDQLMVRGNPATLAAEDLPQQDDREMQALDKVQLARLLAVSEYTENRHHALWVLLARGGLRPSEALRLTWADVLQGAVMVRGQTKTKESRRTVKLPASVMAALAWHRTRQEAEKIAAGSAYGDEARVFANGNGGPLDLKNATRRWFKPLLTAFYPLPAIRVYDLRHTFASIALAAGVPIHVVGRRMGHSRNSTVLLRKYAHVFDHQHEEAVEREEAYLSS